MKVAWKSERLTTAPNPYIPMTEEMVIHYNVTKSSRSETIELKFESGYLWAAIVYYQHFLHFFNSISETLCV